MQTVKRFLLTFLVLSYLMCENISKWHRIGANYNWKCSVGYSGSEPTRCIILFYWTYLQKFVNLRYYKFRLRPSYSVQCKFTRRGFKIDLFHMYLPKWTSRPNFECMFLGDPDGVAADKQKNLRNNVTNIAGLVEHMIDNLKQWNSMQDLYDMVLQTSRRTTVKPDNASGNTK